MGDQRLLGFSFDPDGGNFHCLHCVTTTQTQWRDKRTVAIVEFPTLQLYHGTYNWARALRVEMAGPFGSRLYAIADDGVEDGVRSQTEQIASWHGLLLVPSLPISIRPDKLVCRMCGWTYYRELSPEDVAALTSAMTQDAPTLSERASIFSKIWDVLRRSKPPQR